jgi:hypothetical protein
MLIHATPDRDNRMMAVVLVQLQLQMWLVGVIDAMYTYKCWLWLHNITNSYNYARIGGGSGAVVTYNGEDKKSGGNADVRYMTRRVVLADGFDSGDLRVYLTAYKPDGANIHVYYKLLSNSDVDDFDDKEYQLMTQLGDTNYVSLNSNDFREFTFAPGISESANNSVSYTAGNTAYRNFRTFSIKIVLIGTNPTDPPRVRDFRAIALPEGTV